MRFWRRLALSGRHASAESVLRLVHVATLGALGAALAAEAGVLLAAQPAGVLRLFAPPAGALHPFLPVFLGLLLLPLGLAAIAGFLGRVYGGPRASLGACAVLPVAIYGAVPIYVAMLFVAVPLGHAVLGGGVLLSIAAWATGYRHVLGVARVDGAQCFGLAVLAALVALPMLGALLATLA